MTKGKKNIFKIKHANIYLIMIRTCDSIFYNTWMLNRFYENRFLFVCFSNYILFAKINKIIQQKKNVTFK